MPDLANYDSQFRPRSYFVTDLETATLSRIKGAVRRRLVRRAGISHVDPATSAESLSEQERSAVSRMHPELMGGEYLPNLETGEAEIARFELASVTADVISLRARRADGRIQYRLVDEYDTEYVISPTCSDGPLTFEELVGLIDGIENGGLPRSCRDSNFNATGEAEELVGFVRVSSELYPQLAAYYESEAAEWLEEKLAELAAADLRRGEEEERDRCKRHESRVRELEGIIVAIQSEQVVDAQLDRLIELDGMAMLFSEIGKVSTDVIARLTKKTIDGLIHNVRFPLPHAQGAAISAGHRKTRIKQYIELTGDQSIKLDATRQEVKAWLVKYSHIT